MEGAVAPKEWLLSRICEEFQCTPDVALRQDASLALDIMELRAYAQAKAALEQAKSEQDVPKSPMVDRVFEVKQEIRRRQQDGER